MKKVLTYQFQKLKNWYHFLNAVAASVANGFPARHLTVIGVTGTDGKTTTTTLISHILKTAGKKVSHITTIESSINNQVRSTGLHVTSPNPWIVQKLLRTAAINHTQYVVLEATSHGLDQHRLLGTNISHAVVTNITHEHLDYHPSFEHYIQSKAKVCKHARHIYLNQQDPASKKLNNLLNKKQQLHYFTAEIQNAFSNSINQRFPDQPFNHQNAQAAAAVATALGITEQAIIQAIESFPAVPGRQQPVTNTQGLNVIVDFAHTPNALKHALTSVKPTGKHQLIAVFGAAGQRDSSKRPLMGKVAAEIADEVILTSEDPRTEDPRVIINQIKSGVAQNHGHVHSIVDRQTAINFAIQSLAKQGDTVIVLGKGHEQSLNLDGHTETPWSDVKACQLALKHKSL